MDKQGFVLLLLRLIFGFRLIYGVLDNVVSWEQMIEFKIFLSKNGFPFPLACAIASVYLQLLAGISWLIGYQVRLSSALMVGNFLVAIIGVHLLHRDSYLGTAPAVHLLAIALTLFLIGAGKYSLDQRK